jgi:hypothetical protein
VHQLRAVGGMNDTTLCDVDDCYEGVPCPVHAPEPSPNGQADNHGAVTTPPTRALAELLSDVERFLHRFVSFQNKYQSIAATLWVAHVYAIEAAMAAAYLRITSAVEESGKTTLLEVLGELCGDRALNAVSIRRRRCSGPATRWDPSPCCWTKSTTRSGTARMTARVTSSRW